MDVDATDLGTVAAGGITSSLPAAASSEDARGPQSSSTDPPTAEAPVDGGVDGDTPTGLTADESAASGFRERFREFEEFIRACTAPALDSPKWSFLQDEDRRLRIDMSPLEFVEALEQENGAEALTELGLYERDGDELRLPSWLDGDAPLYVTIDTDNCTLTFGRDSEFLFPMARTALDYALERNPPGSTRATVTLYVVDAHESVEIMQRLGLQAVSSEGLEALGREDLPRLFTGDHRSDLDWRYYLLLVDFNVARLKNQPTAAIGGVIQRLADATDFYGDPARRFGVCRPTAPEFQVLERAITFEDSAQICQLFERWSAAAKSIEIKNLRTQFDTAAASFSVASAALTRALEQSDDFVRRAELLVALPAYREASKGAVIQKFYAAIDGASDPFEQLDLMAAIEYAETFLDSDPRVRAGEAVLAGQTPPSIGELQEELFEQRQRCMVELRRIRRDRRGKR